jgi:acetone carboxylase gamma subunit
LEKYQRNPLDEDNKMKTVNVDNSNQVTILCPKCGLEQTKNVFKFKDSNKRLKANCKCGEAFGFILDFRKNYRKNVQIAGEYLIQEKDE